MSVESLIERWFTLWEKGDFNYLPLSDDFVHRSPFGVIKGKTAYLHLVSSNEEQFLGYSFEIHSCLTSDSLGCVRYTAKKKEFSLEVSEWHYVKDGLINEIIAYYHLPEHRGEDLKVQYPDE